MPNALFEQIEIELESWSGRSQPFRQCPSRYSRWPAKKFRDKAADLTGRMENFYRNLISLARVLRSNVIPVEFTLPDGRRIRMDRGCMKIAERAGFIRRLRNQQDGRVGTVELYWQALR